MTVIRQDQLQHAQESVSWTDPNACFVLWHNAIGITEKYKRKARLVEFYVEAIGDRQHMLDRHIEHLNAFVGRLKDIDAVFAHTPRMCEKMKMIGSDAHVVPAGWDPRTSIRVTDTIRKYAYWGSDVGVRISAVNETAKAHPGLIVSLTGMFGDTLTKELSRYRAALYVPHSEVWSFSTWRIWQSVAAGTPMVIPTCVTGEKLDCWPMEPMQCVTLPWSYSDPQWSAGLASKALAEILYSVSLSTVRENLLDGLSEKFTTDKVIDEWLVPACANVKKNT